MARGYKYAGCRSRMPGHSWNPYVGGEWIPTYGFGEEEMCDHCTTVRRAIVDINGNKTPWNYTYPSDYKTDIPNSDLRLMEIRSRKRRRRAQLAK